MPVSITLLQPLEGTDVVYEPIGPPKPGAKAQYRVSVWFEVRNTDPSKDATIDRIKLNGEKISNQLDAEVEVGMGRKTLAKNGGSVLSFQNIRGKVGPEGGEVDFDDTPVFTAPAPATMQLAVFLVGQTSAAGTASLNLKAGTHAGGALSWPGRGHDLGDNEAWSTSSDHVSGHQVFALDVVMQKYADGALRDTFPVALEAGRRESYVIYGQPVYAMANGVVGWTLGDQSEWSGVGDLKKGETTASAATGVYYGGGNQVFVKTGAQMWVIAHLQRGSIPADVKAGEEVRRGQYLGKVGYSGDSSHPHFHAHVKTRKPGTPNPSLFMAGCDDGFFRPMLFKELWSTPTDGLDAWTAEQWSKLDAQSAPDPYSLLSPGTKAPTWNKALVDKRRYVGIWHPAQHIELRVVRPSFDAFIEAFNFLTAPRTGSGCRRSTRSPRTIGSTSSATSATAAPVRTSCRRSPTGRRSWPTSRHATLTASSSSTCATGPPTASTGSPASSAPARTASSPGSTPTYRRSRPTSTIGRSKASSCSRSTRSATRPAPATGLACSARTPRART